MTIQNAVRRLREEGWVDSRVGSGVYVKEQAKLPAPDDTEHPLATRLSDPRRLLASSVQRSASELARHKAPQKLVRPHLAKGGLRTTAHVTMSSGVRGGPHDAHRCPSPASARRSHLVV
jgi:DNA-binding transcriptional MocR family regulator